MDIRKIFFIMIFLTSCFGNTGAFALNKEYQTKCNEALWKMYDRILEVKNLYPELIDFSKNAVIENENGFNKILYFFKSSDDNSKGLVDEPYAFRLSIKAQAIEDTMPQGSGEVQEWKLPILGLKVGWEVSYWGELTTFDPRIIVEKSLRDLIMLEQDQLPFRLELEPSKAVYGPAEDIEFTVRLRNLGPQAYKVLDLDENSLYCQVDDMTWGSEMPQDTEEKILSPQGSLTKVLKIQGVPTPKEADIFCRYGMSFKGVRPYGQVVIRIKTLP